MDSADTHRNAWVVVAEGTCAITNWTTKLTQGWSDHDFESSDDEDLASVVRDEGFGVNPSHFMHVLQTGWCVRSATSIKRTLKRFAAKLAAFLDRILRNKWARVSG